MDKRLLALVADHQLARKRQRRNLAILALTVAAGLAGLLYAIGEVARSQQVTQSVIDPAKLPPIRPGPQ